MKTVLIVFLIVSVHVFWSLYALEESMVEALSLSISHNQNIDRLRD